MAKHCDIIVSMLPNDAALRSVSSILLEHSKRESIHISCSTVSPATSRDLLASFAAQGKHFAAAPVFARPDGLGRRQAIWMIAGIIEDLISLIWYVSSGHDIATTAAVKLLGTMGKVRTRISTRRHTLKLIYAGQSVRWRCWRSKCCQTLWQFYDCGNSLLLLPPHY